MARLPEGVASSGYRASIEAGRANEIKDLCEEAQAKFPLWIQSCEMLLEKLTSIHPSMYSRDVIAKLTFRHTHHLRNIEKGVCV